MTILLVAAGGALGAIARYLVDFWVVSRGITRVPLGTLVVNVSGSFALGLLVGILGTTGGPDWILTLLGTGFLAAYTTFSTWMFEAAFSRSSPSLPHGGPGSRLRGCRSLARKCGPHCRRPLTPDPPLADPGARAEGRRVRELALPESALIALVARGDEIVPPRGRTRIQSGDYVFVVMKSDIRPVVDRMFSSRPSVAGEPLTVLELPMDARTRIGDLEDFYGIHLDPDPERSLGELMSERLGDGLEEGAEILAGDIRLAARKVVGGKVA